MLCPTGHKFGADEDAGIQDLTISVARGLASTEAAMALSNSEYQAWVSSQAPFENAYYMHFAAAPVGSGFEAPRLFDAIVVGRFLRRWMIWANGVWQEAILMPPPERSRKLVRGVRLERSNAGNGDDSGMGLQLDVFQTGRVSSRLRLQALNGRYALDLGWVVVQTIRDLYDCRSGPGGWLGA